jgi:hypothetical protein
MLAGPSGESNSGHPHPRELYLSAYVKSGFSRNIIATSPTKMLKILLIFSSSKSSNQINEGGHDCHWIGRLFRYESPIV